MLRAGTRRRLLDGFSFRVWANCTVAPRVKTQPQKHSLFVSQGKSPFLFLLSANFKQRLKELSLVKMSRGTLKAHLKDLGQRWGGYSSTSDTRRAILSEQRGPAQPFRYTTTSQTVMRMLHRLNVMSVENEWMCNSWLQAALFKQHHVSPANLKFICSFCSQLYWETKYVRIISGVGVSHHKLHHHHHHHLETFMVKVWQHITFANNMLRWMHSHWF